MKYLIIPLLLFLTACPETKMPKVDISFWAGDSGRRGITRAQEEKTISCGEKDFDEFVCLSYDDLKIIYATFLKCNSWKGEVSQDNLKRFMDRNEELHKRLFQRGVKKQTITIPPPSEDPSPKHDPAEITEWRDVL